MRKVFLLLMIGISFHCNAQISRDSAYEFLKTNILPNNWEDKEINIYVSKELIRENAVITIYCDTFVVSPNYKTWFFYVDETPRTGLYHDSKFIFINDENNFVVVDMESPHPHCIKNMDFLRGIRPRKVKPIRPKPTPLDSILLEKRKSEKNTNTSGNDHAVIISGGYCPELNYTRYWNNCSAIYNTLKNTYGYNEDNIYVIMSDGTDPTPDHNDSLLDAPSIIQCSLDFDDDSVPDIQYAATKANIAKVFDSLSVKIDSLDNVFVFVTDHGGIGSTIALWDSVFMTKSEFESEINKVEHAKTVNILMLQCYSGGYTTLSKDNIVVTTSCSDIQQSNATSDLNYDEFCYHWVSAVRHYTLNSNIFVDADYNNDSFVSMDEAFQYAKNADTQQETPQYSSPSNPNVGAYLTLNGRFDMDLYIRDSINDNGNEPSNVKYVYNSPYIWIEDLNNEPDNTPEGGVLHNVCIRVYNKSFIPSTGTERLIVNWAKAGVNLPWPNAWNGNTSLDCVNVPMGGLIKDTLLPIINPGSSVVVKIPWMVPDGNDYDCGIFEGSAEQWHFCLLARVHDSKKIMGENSDSCGIGPFVEYNNNVAWKNISIINGANNKAVVWLQNHLSTTQKFRLHFTAHPNSKNELLGQYAETHIRLSSNVFKAWASGGKKGNGISVVGENRLRITSDNATLENIPLPANAVGMLETEVNFLSEVIPQGKTFTFDIAMYDSNGKTLYGGEHYMAIRDDERTFDVVAMQNQTAMPEEPVTFSAVNIGEPATYLWYNAAGDSIGSGTTLSTTATQSQQYRLSVQATADGYKGYDTVSLVVRNGAITSLSPNPASGQAVVTYNLASSVSSASIVVTNGSGLPVYNSAINVSATTHTLNLQNLVAGQYSLRLVSSTGEVLDTKTLIVQ